MRRVLRISPLQNLMASLLTHSNAAETAPCYLILHAQVKLPRQSTRNQVSASICAQSRTLSPAFWVGWTFDG